jgi:hypothetical protein
MGLIFQVGDDSHVRAKIRCDHCGGIIENYADGVAVLKASDPKPGTIIEPIFHCAACEEHAEKTNPSRRSVPIDHFMLYVLNNIQLSPNSLEKAAHEVRTTSAF